MEKMCECNSEWQVCYDEFPYRRQVCYNAEAECFPLFGNCSICHYDFWYDADYEDMIFDLRKMNE